MGILDKLFGQAADPKDKDNDDDLSIGDFFNLLGSSFQITALQTDFAAPEMWERQAYIKFIVEGRLSSGPFLTAYHEQSSSPSQLNPGHWLGLCIQHAGKDVGDPRVFLSLGSFNSTHQQLLWQPHAEKMRALFFHLVQNSEPQYCPPAAVNIFRLSKLPWGAAAAQLHFAAPPAD